MEPWCIRKLSIEFDGFWSRRHTGPVHAAIEIEVKIERDACRRCGPRKRKDRALIVDQRREFGGGVFLHQLNEPLHVRSNRLVREEHIGRSAHRRDLRLRDRRALEPGDAVVDLHPDHLGQLVGLHVRPETLDAPGDLDHPADVLFDAIGVHQQRRRRNLVDVGDRVPVGAGIRLSRGRGHFLTLSVSAFLTARGAPPPLALARRRRYAALHSVASLGPQALTDKGARNPGTRTHRPSRSTPSRSSKGYCA